MSKLEKLRHKLTKHWIKLLRAEARHDPEKIRKHEHRIIELELEEQKAKQHK